MLLLKNPNSTGFIANPGIRAMVEASFRQLLTDFDLLYAPDTHGWFLVLEHSQELDNTEPFHGLYSMRTILTEQLFEHVQRCDGFFEVVVALGDAEAVAVYVPESLLSPEQQAELARLSEGVE